MFSTCCVIFWNLTTFTTTCGSLVSTICSTTRFWDPGTSRSSTALISSRPAPFDIRFCGITLTFLPVERRYPRSFYPNLHLLLVLLLRDLVGVLLLGYLDSLLHQLVGRGNLLRYHVCRTDLCFVLSGACVIETVLRPWGVGVGHPRPLRLPGPSVPWVSFPGPTGVPSDAQRGWHREHSANPLWLFFSGDGGHVLWTSCIHAFF